MRVLFVTHNVPRFDGDVAGSFVLRLAAALQTAGARVEIIAPGTNQATIDTLDGVVIHRVPYASRERMTLAYTGTMVEQVKRSWSGRLALLGLLRALRRAAHVHLARAEQAGDPYDVIHAHWWFPAGLALWHGLPSRTSGRATHVLKRVLTMHGSDVRLAQTMAPARRLMASVLAEYDARTSVSQWLANTAHSIAPALPVQVLPMPVDNARFVAPTGACTRQDVLFVGRLNAQKGVADLVRALAHPALAHAALDVVGDGPDHDALHALASASGVSHRIRWHGTVTPDQLVPLYQRAAAVAMPSHNEGLGLVAVEAQMCGAPVVAYNSGGLPDVVRPSEGGTLVSPGDVEGLAAALGALVNDPAEAVRRGALARSSVAARFSPASVAASYLALYRDVQ
ncbi:MAG: glycosyltransferase family 4 protein [Gemmatimonadaceae bacterium]|nr:glycosyltransferase family 4 protein [Gemmatimonadaceae bacterium]